MGGAPQPRRRRHAAASSACPFLALAVVFAFPGVAAAATQRYTFNADATRIR
jgi:hypothetical protein